MNRELPAVITLTSCCILAIMAAQADADGAKAAWPEPTVTRVNSNRTRVTPRPYSTDDGATFPISNLRTANTNTSTGNSSVAPAPTQSPKKKVTKTKRKQRTRRSN
ncbi:MAG: hypothetical protein WBD16_03020 [Pyrinomonadaceae bacterium]